MNQLWNTPLSEWTLERLVSQKLLDLCIRVGLLSFLIVYCYQIFYPFISLMLWSIILAVTLYPLHVFITRKMGDTPGRAALTLVLAILLGVLFPTALLAISFADSISLFIKHIQEGTLHVPPPNDSVVTWPLIGQKVYDFWAAAHNDLAVTAAKFEPKIRAITIEILGYAASVGTGILKFLVALVLSGFWMVHAPNGHSTAIAIANRVVGSANGETMVVLTISTIRAVAQGVIGIACIQALLLGIGFVFIGIPAAGILALVVLLLGIVQIPAMLVTLPVIVYVFVNGYSTTAAVSFTVYAVVAGSIDNVLKPIMLGRGVDAPMLVILLGALGGMATGGLIGLFLGPVLLALGYQLFMMWVYRKDSHEGGEESSTNTLNR